MKQRERERERGREVSVNVCKRMKVRDLQGVTPGGGLKGGGSVEAIKTLRRDWRKRPRQPAGNQGSSVVRLR